MRELGKRHANYGIDDASYETFGKALAWTFERTLGDEFTPKVRAAWEEAYQMLSQAMRSTTAG